MTDPYELLARADDQTLFIAAATNSVSKPLTYDEALLALIQAGRTMEALAQALRAALATRPQPDELARLRGIEDAATALVAMFGGTLSQYLGPLSEALAVAGSATPDWEDDDG